MKLKLSVAVMCLSILSACDPSVPELSGENFVGDKIVLDGITMTYDEFREKYCEGGKKRTRSCWNAYRTISIFGRSKLK
jgi:hypothetical protein